MTVAPAPLTASPHRNTPQWFAVCAFVFIAASAFPTSAEAQKDPKSTAACPTAAETDHRYLQGRWRAELAATGSAPAATALLQLGPHPELAQSVRGSVQRDGATVQVSGDVDDGDLTLEESNNGTNISATWIGRVVDGSCGKEIRGTWNNAHPTPTAPSTPFVLRRQAGWQ